MEQEFVGSIPTPGVMNLKTYNNITDIGFTGTQEGTTPEQTLKLIEILSYFKNKDINFHHGCCIGADKVAYILAYSYGYIIHFHPPINKSKAFEFIAQENDIIHPDKEYLDRNQDIALSQLLIATPSTPLEKIRSGTWVTVRYARKNKRHIIVINPDGTITKE